MAYDEDVANAIREALAGESAVTEKRMFGGLAFLVGGHMAIAASRTGGLLVRVAPAEVEALLRDPHVEPAGMRNAARNGWLSVAPAGAADVAAIRPWVLRGLGVVAALPPKG